MEIIIPAKKDTFVPLFLACAFVGFIAFEFVDPKQIFHSATGQPDAEMMLRYTAGASGIFLACGLWLWYLSGKEVITFSTGEVTILKERTITKAKTYNLREACNFRAAAVKAPDIRSIRPRYHRLPKPWQIANSGTLQFDYGGKIIAFGNELDRAEGEYILERLRAKKLIS
jgi:hypothetical protein